MARKRHRARGVARNRARIRRAAAPRLRETVGGEQRQGTTVSGWMYGRVPREENPGFLRHRR